jgi:opacity protein-like surface antigen
MFHTSSPKVRPYAGAGLGLHFFHTKVQVSDMNLGGGFIIPGFTAEDSATKVGLDLGGGASTPLSPKTDLFADFWYTLADIDQVSLKAGVSFLLSR